MDERRHDVDPVPPGGIERRHCDDAGCRAAREEWLASVVMPKMMLKFGAMILGAVTLLSGIFLYMSKNAIRDFALEAKEQYVSVAQHRGDIGRVEAKIDRMEVSITTAMEDVAARLDRNLQEIKDRSR